jgi:hypothetical protein
MALYGGSRDISFIRHINKELINNIIEQQIGYYILALDKTSSNLYGESLQKTYNDPVLVNCLIERTPPTWTETDLGTDVTQDITVRFLRDILVDIQLVPKVGDIVLWEESYYEISSLIENQLVVGKDPSYSYSSSTDDFGSSISIICNTYYIPADKVAISPYKERT